MDNFTLEVPWGRLRDFCEENHLTEISYLVHSVPLGLPGSFAGDASRSTLDPDWCALYDRGRWIHTDPIMHAAARRLSPIVWERYEVGQDWDELPPSRQAMVRSAQDYGYNAGACCPFHGPAGVFSTFSVLSKLPAERFKQIWREKESEILSLARDVHSLAVQSVECGMRPDQLTPKEQQVLSASAHGLSAKVIAGRMKCSKFTVEKHLANARNKLGARDTTHAVALALTRGLIWPNGYRNSLTLFD